jgi:hypothetical protein
MGMPATVLLIQSALLHQPSTAAQLWLERLRTSGVAVVPAPEQAHAGALLKAVAAHHGSAADSWLITGDADAGDAAASAGLAGIVLVGVAAPPNATALLAIGEAIDLADAPRVMIPRGGGCWHDRR